MKIIFNLISILENANINGLCSSKINLVNKNNKTLRMCCGRMEAAGRLCVFYNTLKMKMEFVCEKQKTWKFSQIIFKLELTRCVARGEGKNRSFKWFETDSFSCSSKM